MEHFPWSISIPVAILLFALCFTFGFRETLSVKLRQLILKKFGEAEFDTIQPEVQQKALEETTSISILDDPLRRFDSPIIVEQEKSIVIDLEKQAGASQEKKIQLLIRALAHMQRVAAYEFLARTIWGSQYELLKFLNTRPVLVAIDEVKNFYDQAAVTFPSIFNHYSYEQYLGFLQTNVLILRDGNKIGITIRGVDFLAWCVASKEPVRKIF